MRWVRAEREIWENDFVFEEQELETIKGQLTPRTSCVKMYIASCASVGPEGYLVTNCITIAVVPIYLFVYLYIYPLFSQESPTEIQDLFFEGVLQRHIGIISCFLFFLGFFSFWQIHFFGNYVKAHSHTIETHELLNISAKLREDCITVLKCVYSRSHERFYGKA